MFGSVFTFRPRAGEEQRLQELMDRWGRDRRPKVPGVVASYMFKSRSHPGEWVGVAVFDSEASYRKNAEDPEQDRWYRQVRECLEDDPAWNDGDVVAMD